MKSRLTKPKLFSLWSYENRKHVVMATSGDLSCFFCTTKIAGKAYRSLSSKHSKEVYGQVFNLLAIPTDLQGFACNLCANKLNRIKKLSDDLKTKLDSIKAEREKLISTLKSMPGLAAKPCVKTTPRSWGKSKRPYSLVKQTPTPKSLVKKGLFLSPGSSQFQITEPTVGHALQSSVQSKSATEGQCLPLGQLGGMQFQIPDVTDQLQREQTSHGVLSSVQDVQSHSAKKCLFISPARRKFQMTSHIQGETAVSHDVQSNVQDVQNHSAFSAIIEDPFFPLSGRQFPIPGVTDQMQGEQTSHVPSSVQDVQSHSVKKCLFLSPARRKFQITDNLQEKQTVSHDVRSNVQDVQTYQQVKASHTGDVIFKDQCTQTRDLTETFDVKITVKYAGMERNKIIREENMKSALKAILNNSSPRAVLKHLQLNSLYKVEMLHLVEKDLNAEVAKLLKETEIELFHGHAKDNEKLLHFDWNKKEESLRSKAPFLSQILTTVLNPKQKKEKQFIPHMMTATAVLLYGRSQRQNQLQYILGLVMDKCGLTKEGMKILHELGIAVSTTSIQRKKKQLIAQQEKQIKTVATDYVKYVELQHGQIQHNNSEEQSDSNVTEENTEEMDAQSKDHVPFEVLGDNLDITITPSKMTLQSQRKSLHWFLLLVKQKRVIVDDVNIPDESYTKKDLNKISCVSYLPNIDNFQSLMQSFTFHVAQILLKYLSHISQVKEHYPKHITHRHMEEMKRKTLFLNCDLIDASENSSQGMIEILQKVHSIAVPHLRNEEHKNVLEKVVFGGDVLTNERAFSAQEAMQNADIDTERLGGVIHRPEGLHRLMNFTLVSLNTVVLQFS